MIPEDDARWPKCGEHDEHRHWCNFIRTWMIEGNDAESLEPGLRYCVPIVPAFELYAEVSIGENVVPDLAWELALVKANDDPFNSNGDEFISLGLWSREEGRVIIASAINDWIESVLPDKCNYHRHGFEEEVKQQTAKAGSTAAAATYEKATNWCLSYYGMCYECRLAQLKRAATPVNSFNASSFGLDPNAFGGGPGSSSSTVTQNARQQRARQALQQRYGQRIIAGLEPTPLGDNTWKAAEF